MRFKVRPQSHNTIVQQGSIVRVRLERNAAGYVSVFHDYLYEVERIRKTLAGDIQYECTHVPVDSENRSLIALDVANAVGAGILLTSNLTGLGCDINSAVDDTVPDEEFTEPPADPGDGLTPISVNGGFTGGGPGSPGGGGALPPSESPAPEPTPDDGGDPQPIGPMTACPVPGGAAGIPPTGICAGAIVKRTIGNIGDPDSGITQTGGAELYSLPLSPPGGGGSYNDKFVTFSFECPDGPPQIADPCNSPQPDPTGCSQDMTWPTGTWNPNGANRWTYVVSNRISHSYFDSAPFSCDNPRPLADSTAVVTTVAGQVAWHSSPSSQTGPCPDVIQYGDIFIYTSSFSNICDSGNGVLYGFARTGGTREYSLTVTVEPVSPGPGDELFPSRQEFASRYL
jgi:hypothetical protein